MISVSRLFQTHQCKNLKFQKLAVGLQQKFHHWREHLVLKRGLESPKSFLSPHTIAMSPNTYHDYVCIPWAIDKFAICISWEPCKKCPIYNQTQFCPQVTLSKWCVGTHEIAEVMVDWLGHFVERNLFRLYVAHARVMVMYWLQIVISA